MSKPLFNINPKVVKRYLIGGLLLGGGGASVVELLHSINVANKARSLKKEPTETDKNTIVLTLPSKKGESVKTRIDDNYTKEYVVDKTQSRNVATGKFGPKIYNKEASRSKRISNNVKKIYSEGGTGWPTMTASVLAALAGVAGGATLVSRLMERQRKISLRRDVNKAKEEYLDLLSEGMGKYSSVVDSIIPAPATLTKAAASPFGFLDTPLATAALLTILGSGATAYVTKRVMDENLASTRDKYKKDAPKVQRIIFRSAPGDEDDDDQDKLEKTSEHDFDVIKAGLMVMMDHVSGSDRFTGDPIVKAAMAKEKVAFSHDARAADWDNIITALYNSPETALSLARLYKDYTTKNPLMRSIKRNVISLPIVRNRAVNKLMSQVMQMRNAPIAPGGMAKASAFRPGLRGGPLRLSPAIAAGSFVGSAVGRAKSGHTDMERVVEDVLDRRERDKEVEVDDLVQISANDKRSKAYIAANRKKIQRLVKRLAAEGQI